jgi:hypothetical protein
MWRSPDGYGNIVSAYRFGPSGMSGAAFALESRQVFIQRSSIALKS